MSLKTIAALVAAVLLTSFSANANCPKNTGNIRASATQSYSLGSNSEGLVHLNIPRRNFFAPKVQFDCAVIEQIITRRGFEIRLQEDAIFDGKPVLKDNQGHYYPSDDARWSVGVTIPTFSGKGRRQYQTDKDWQRDAAQAMRIASRVAVGVIRTMSELNGHIKFDAGDISFEHVAAMRGTNVSISTGKERPGYEPSFSLLITSDFTDNKPRVVTIMQAITAYENSHDKN